ncbi:hypothetical protein [Bizionia sp.]
MKTISYLKYKFSAKPNLTGFNPDSYRGLLGFKIPITIMDY